MRIWSVGFAVLFGVVAATAQDTPVVNARSKTEPQAAVDLAEIFYPGAAGEVRRTVIHEVAHHFGIDDARLEELGW